MPAARDVLFALIPVAHRLDVRVSGALPILETTTRQLLAQEALVRREGGLSVTDVAEALGCTRPAARQTIERLLEMERVTIGKATLDARSRNVTLTDAGRELLTEEWQLAEAELRSTLVEFNEVELKVLVHILDRMNERTKMLVRQRQR